MAQATLSAKGRRHARNIARSAKRRASTEPCIAGTDKPVKDRGLAALTVQKRIDQEKRIAAKRTRRRDTAQRSVSDRRLRTAAGRHYRMPGQMVYKHGEWVPREDEAQPTTDQVEGI